MAKIDIQDVSRLIPIHSMDHSFLGVMWQHRVLKTSTLGRKCR